MTRANEPLASNTFSRRTLLGLAAFSGGAAIAGADSLFGQAYSVNAATIWNHPFAGAYAPNSDGYGPRTLNGQPNFHRGHDFAPGAGVSVRAAAAGVVVTNPAVTGQYWPGNHTLIRHDNGYHSLYAHLLAGTETPVGTSVNAGQQVGLVGNTGESYGAHLHFEIWTSSSRDSHVNPAPYVLAPAPLAGQSAPANRPISQTYGTSGGWQRGLTGISTASGMVSAVRMGGSWPQVMTSEGGFLHQIYGTSTGWRKGNTGVPLGSGSFSAVNMGGTWPQVMAIDNSRLYQIVGTANGWQKLDTGQVLIGQISAVNMGGTWPAIMLAQGGILYSVTGSAAGWQTVSTGISVTGQISAVNMGPNNLQVLVAENGFLYQIYYNGTSWQKANTGVSATGNVAAVNMGGNWPQAMVSEGGSLYQIAGSSAGWNKQSTGMLGGAAISAVNMGGLWPQVIQIG